MTNMKDSTSLPTEFGVDLKFALSDICLMPAVCGSHNGEEREFEEAPTIVVRCPDAMISACRAQGGAHQKMGVMSAGDSWFGLVYLLGDNHVATAMFDCGGPEGQAVLQFALATDEFRLLMVGETDQVLTVHVLSEALREGLLKAAAAREACFSNFSSAVTSIKEGYVKAATWRNLGIEPMRLQSLTASLCLSSGGASGVGQRFTGVDRETLH